VSIGEHTEQSVDILAAALRMTDEVQQRICYTGGCRNHDRLVRILLRPQYLADAAKRIRVGQARAPEFVYAPLALSHDGPPLFRLEILTHTARPGAVLRRQDRSTGIVTHR
jgi:hypothetical protein